MDARPRISRASITALIAAAMAMLVWALAARALGPCDLWDQTQPKTVSYTTDIVANGHWILPVERGAFPATKPPLYNWIAAPFVAALGYDSQIAHKFPSIIALCACWLIMVRLGRSLGQAAWGRDDRRAAVLGWSAGVMVPANYALFKLGFLARPDMLLVLWITLGWVACTAVLARESERSQPAAVVTFWACVALAALTKGPPAVLLILYAVVAARVVTGRWSAVHRLRWWWGLPAAAAAPAAWAIIAWRIDPEHVYEQLWYAEVWGRVTGRGPEGSGDGPLDILLSIHEMPLYFVARFAPWSVLTIVAMVALLMRDAGTGRTRWRAVAAPLNAWLLGAMVLVLMTVVVFSLSAGKRADYIAPCYPAAALLAAWPLTRGGRSVVPIAIGAAVVTMVAMTVNNIRQPAVDVPGFAQHVETCIAELRERIAERPARVVFHRAGNSHLQAMLGVSVRDDREALDAALAEGEPFWVVAGRRKPSIPRFDQWFATVERFDATVTVVHRCDAVEKTPYWPVEMSLYWVEPGES